jgi:hypothetical protein
MHEARYALSFISLASNHLRWLWDPLTTGERAPSRSFPRHPLCTHLKSSCSIKQVILRAYRRGGHIQVRIHKWFSYRPQVSLKERQCVRRLGPQPSIKKKSRHVALHTGGNAYRELWILEYLSPSVSLSHTRPWMSWKGLVVLEWHFPRSVSDLAFLVTFPLLAIKTCYNHN